MEVNNVLANEMIYLSVCSRHPIVVKANVIVAIAVVKKACEVADRCVQPDVKVLIFGTWNRKTEVGCIAGNVPVTQPGIEPLLKLATDILV